MRPFAEALTQRWKTSARFRIGLTLAAVYFLLRLAVSYSWQMGWMVVKGWPASTDLKVYWDSGLHFRERQDLYFAPQKNYSVFVYAPPFALLMSPVSRVPFKVLPALHLLLTTAAYAALYGRWWAIFKRHQRDDVAGQMIRWLPLWLVSMAIIYDTNYLNIYTLMALLAVLLLEAVLNERLGWALLCLALILPVKPHWAFPLALPFVLRRWRFAIKLLAGSVAVYAAVMSITLLVGGPDYVIHQYGDYVHTLQAIPKTFHWFRFEEHHLGYNHSLMQLMIFFFGANSRTFAAVTALKALLWLPLLFAAWRTVRRPVPHSPAWVLEWALALYAGTFLWIDVLHEVTLGVFLFTYLQVTLSSRTVRRLLHVIVWPYLLGDLLGILAYSVHLPDPMRYVPLVLIALLAFYAILVARLLESVGVVWSPLKSEKRVNVEGVESL